MFDMLPANLPWAALGLAFGLCLAVSALGFLRTDWFISIGYGFSVAAQAALFALLYRVRGVALVLGPAAAAAIGAYGLRLGGYLVARERSPSFGRRARRVEGSAAPASPGR